VAAWMLEALKAEHELTVLAWEPLDLPKLNRFCGTALQPHDFRLLQPPARLRAPLNLAGRLGLDPHPVKRCSPATSTRPKRRGGYCETAGYTLATTDTWTRRAGCMCWDGVRG
jgi:hypothetical protein